MDSNTVIVPPAAAEVEKQANFRQNHHDETTTTANNDAAGHSAAAPMKTPGGFPGGALDAPPPVGAFPPVPPSGYLPPLPGGTAQPPAPNFSPAALAFPGENGPPHQPPPIGDWQQLAGYEGISFDSMPSAPPPYNSETSMGPPPERPPLTNFPRLTEEGAREALLHFASEECCYGSKAAQNMQLNDMEYNSAFHYTLESFCEKRETSYALEPYEGGPFSTGYAPGPWEISVAPPHAFRDSKAILEVPNTTSIKPCHVCMALGHTRCTSCSGRGHSDCSWCHGHGRRHVAGSEHREHCTSCSGSGHQRCFHCHGHGHVKCNLCNGRTQLRCFVRLTITWKNHVEDHISDTASLPANLIRDVSGQLAFEEKALKVWPIGHFPDASVNLASQRIVSNHQTAFPQERLLEQKHQVRIIPITAVDYAWKSTLGKFYVYGFENKVHFPDYPQQCCCGLCSIM